MVYECRLCQFKHGYLRWTTARQQLHRTTLNGYRDDHDDNDPSVDNLLGKHLCMRGAEPRHPMACAYVEEFHHTYHLVIYHDSPADSAHVPGSRSASKKAKPTARRRDVTYHNARGSQEYE